MPKSRGRRKNKGKRSASGLSHADLQAEVLATMAGAGTPPQFIYAYRKTGLIGTESNKDRMSKEDRDAWEAAIDEYFALEESAKQPNRPPQEQWSTKIPELLVAPFTRDDLDQVRRCFAAIAPIEREGLKLVTRIELAAALIVTACEQAYEDAGGPGTAADRFAATEQLILRRAREIYAQGYA